MSSPSELIALARERLPRVLVLVIAGILAVLIFPLLFLKEVACFCYVTVRRWLESSEFAAWGA